MRADSPRQGEFLLGKHNLDAEEVKCSEELLEGTGVSRKRSNQKCCSGRTRRVMLLLCGVVFLTFTVVGILFFVRISREVAILPASPADNPRIPPSEPPQPKILFANATTILIEWESPSENTAQITNYHIRTSGNQSNFFTVSHENKQFMLSRLMGSSNYCFEVQACSSVGCGNLSKKSCFTTAEPLPPGTSSRIRGENASLSSLLISWDSVDNRGSLVDIYQVQYTSLESSLTKSLQIKEYRQELTRKNIEDLMSGTQYLFRVRAHNQVGWGNWSEASILHTDYENSAKPTAPHDLDCDFVEATRLNLRWEGPSSDGGSLLLGFEVSIRANSSLHKTEWSKIIFSSEPHCMISGLQANHTYILKVRSLNRIGNGPWSSSLTVKTKSPSAPRSLQKISLESL